MTTSLDRDALIALLDRLGSADDAEALEAARQVHARIAEAGLSWADLLVPAASPGDAPPPVDAAMGAASEATGDGEKSVDSDGDSLALIGKLLARPAVSEELRRELEGYKTDIAEGDFSDADRKYLRAVYQRLST